MEGGGEWQMVGGRALKPLLEAMETDNIIQVRKAAVVALGGMPDPRVLETLLSALYHPDVFIQRGAADGLDLAGWEPDYGRNGERYRKIKRQAFLDPAEIAQADRQQAQTTPVPVQVAPAPVWVSPRRATSPQEVLMKFLPCNHASIQEGLDAGCIHCAMAFKQAEEHYNEQHRDEAGS